MSRNLNPPPLFWQGKVVEKYVWSFVNTFNGTTKTVSFVITDGKVSDVPAITDGIKGK